MKQKKKKSSKSNSAGGGGGFINVDPERIRFQHSRIRPHFSGCGRSVHSTLDAMRDGTLSPYDLPPIQVIVGPDENDGKGPWYFSLNNRRLWVLKRCREEGLLENDLIKVRVRQPKSINELARYSIENCAVEAKFIREREFKKEVQDNNDERSSTCSNNSRIEGKRSLSHSASKIIQNINIDRSDDISVNVRDSEHLSLAAYTNRFCFDDDGSSDNESM